MLNCINQLPSCSQFSKAFHVEQDGKDLPLRKLLYYYYFLHTYCTHEAKKPECWQLPFSVHLPWWEKVEQEKFSCYFGWLWRWVVSAAKLLIEIGAAAEQRVSAARLFRCLTVWLLKQINVRVTICPAANEAGQEKHWHTQTRCTCFLCLFVQKWNILKDILCLQKVLLPCTGKCQQSKQQLSKYCFAWFVIFFDNIYPF